MARLDQIAPVKHIAQFAAVLGRTFSRDRLVAASPFEEVLVDTALSQLVGSELIYRRGTEPNLRYDGAFVFDRASFPPYANRKACDKASFTANDAVTHVYGRQSDADHPRPHNSLPNAAARADAAAEPDVVPFHGPEPVPRLPLEDALDAHAANATFLKVDALLLARIRDAASAGAAAKRGD